MTKPSYTELPIEARPLKRYERKKRRTITDPQILIDEAERAIDAMEQLASAMTDAEPLMDDAQKEHFLTFERQMQSLFKVDTVEMEEPYLPSLLAEAQLTYIQRLERHLTPLEQFAEASLADAEALISGEAVSVTITTKAKPTRLTRPIFIPDSLKKLDFGKRLKPQIDATIDNEAGWAGRWLNARLDKHRQQQFGVSHYVWSTVGDDKVRDSHASNDGGTFSWDSPPATGHPGEEANCRCVAIPVAEGFEPNENYADAEGVEVAVLDKALFAAIAASIINSAKLATRTLTSTAKTTKELAKQASKVTGETANKVIKISEKQLQKKYKHAKDFGLPKNYSKQNAEKFRTAIEKHIKDNNTKIIKGEFRGQKNVTHHYNKNTQINVIKDSDGNLVSVWRLSDKQAKNVIKHGKLGGTKCTQSD